MRALRCPHCVIRAALRRQMCVVAASSGAHRTRTPLSEERRHELLSVPQTLGVEVAPIPSHFKKRAVALHLGYVGAPFKGNQSNSTLPRGSTVDDVVEDALLGAGLILPTNYGSRGLSRLAWSRSSRTDKGVSSLATIVTCRLEVDEAWWPPQGGDGLQLCDLVNSKLPPLVRVFAASPVPRRFQARHACSTRTYHYLLPLHVLSSDAAVAAERIATLSAALQRFQGTHPFHNFTARARYRPGAVNKKKTGAAKPAIDSAPRDEEDEGEGDEESGTEEAPAPAVLSAPVPPGIDGAYATGTYWCVTPQQGDAVGNAHFRRIADTTVQGPFVCVHTGSPYVRIVFVGESFLLHQIRKMVATAVAVARGRLGIDFIEAALTRPSRARTPMAPASTLVLADASFWPFKPDTSGGPRTGEEGSDSTEQHQPQQRSLAISDATRARVAAWATEVLEPSLGPALASDDWQEWIANLDGPLACPLPEEVAVIVAYAREYRATRMLRDIVAAAEGDATCHEVQK